MPVSGSRSQDKREENAGNSRFGIKEPETLENMNCPKCGFQQDETVECVRCGLIIARYRGKDATSRREREPHPDMSSSAFRFVRNFYRIFRWIALASFLLALILILNNSKPPLIEISPDATKRAEEKIQGFRSAATRGSDPTLTIDESELNSWLRENLALNKSPASTFSSNAHKPEPMGPTVTNKTKSVDLDDAAIEQAKSSVRDIKIKLREESLLLYAVFDLYGMNQTLELEGTVTVMDGYLRLNPTSGKLGSFPLMAGTLRQTADRIFGSPENKEKFRLPPYIKDIRIEHGQFVITSE